MSIIFTNEQGSGSDDDVLNILRRHVVSITDTSARFSSEGISGSEVPVSAHPLFNAMPRSARLLEVVVVAAICDVTVTATLDDGALVDSSCLVGTAMFAIASNTTVFRDFENTVTVHRPNSDMLARLPR